MFHTDPSDPESAFIELQADRGYTRGQGDFPPGGLGGGILISRPRGWVGEAKKEEQGWYNCDIHLIYFFLPLQDEIAFF